MDHMTEALKIGEPAGTIAVDPETINTKPPTWDERCGSTAGSAAHARRGERRCRDCQDASNDARIEWIELKDAKDEAERKRLAALRRPSMASILTKYGLEAPAAAIFELASHGYGDYGDALDEAANACPVDVEKQTTGGGIRAWLRGRAMLIRKEL